MKKLSTLFLVLLLALFTGQALFAQDGAVLSNEADKTGTMDELKISMDTNNAQLAKARQTYIQSLFGRKERQSQLSAYDRVAAHVHIHAKSSYWKDDHKRGFTFISAWNRYSRSGGR